MKTYAHGWCGLGLMALLASSKAFAGDLSIPHSFSPNTPAVAAQVNENFGAVETAVDDNAVDIAALQAAVAALQANDATQQATINAQAATIASLQSDLAAVQDNSVLDLDGLLTLVNDPATSQLTARFSAVNVQVVNGTNDTENTNGLGNLIVGYNEDAGIAAFCSNGDYADETTCTSNGGIWAVNQRTGSHNLILGQANAYSRYGGLVAGSFSIVNGIFASVSGGQRNMARGRYSSVSAGLINTAIGDSSSVNGGYFNTTSGPYSSVSGGANRSATGGYDWRAGALLQDE
ncbi:MAG: hypothetical protein E6Q43_07130 [Dokdonella sp.]|nr:MAG: hypothetical protein EYC71_10915 [Gammaproteobacteria bacterium]TXI71984.1 MAG: hypothetical protein E6Q43_07130 [Dokdonella sp.]